MLSSPWGSSLCFSESTLFPRGDTTWRDGVGHPLLPLLPWRSSLAWLPRTTRWSWSDRGPLSRAVTVLSIWRPFSDCTEEKMLLRFPKVIGLSKSRHKHKAHLAFTLTGLKGAVLTTAHHYGFIRRNASSVVQPAAPFPLAPAVTKDLAGCRFVSCVRWSRRSFGALNESNINWGIWWGRRAAIEHGNVMISSNVIVVESFKLWGIWRKEELFQCIGQSGTWLNLSDIFRSEGKLMLTWPLRGFTLWDTAKTWKPNVGWLVKWLP